MDSSLYTDRHIHHHNSVFLYHVSSSIREPTFFQAFSLAYRTPQSADSLSSLSVPKNYKACMICPCLVFNCFKSPFNLSLLLIFGGGDFLVPQTTTPLFLHLGHHIYSLHLLEICFLQLPLCTKLQVSIMVPFIEPTSSGYVKLTVFISLFTYLMSQYYCKLIGSQKIQFTYHFISSPQISA